MEGRKHGKKEKDEGKKKEKRKKRKDFASSDKIMKYNNVKDLNF